MRTLITADHLLAFEGESHVLLRGGAVVIDQVCHGKKQAKPKA